MIHWSVRRRFRHREITGSGGVSIFFRRGGILFTGSTEER